MRMTKTTSRLAYGSSRRLASVSSLSLTRLPLPRLPWRRSQLRNPKRHRDPQQLLRDRPTLQNSPHTWTAIPRRRDAKNTSRPSGSSLRYPAASSWPQTNRAINPHMTPTLAIPASRCIWQGDFMESCRCYVALLLASWSPCCHHMDWENRLSEVISPTSIYLKDSLRSQRLDHHRRKSEPHSGLGTALKPRMMFLNSKDSCPATKAASLPNWRSAGSRLWKPNVSFARPRHCPWQNDLGRNGARFAVPTTSKWPCARDLQEAKIHPCPPGRSPS